MKKISKPTTNPKAVKFKSNLGFGILLLASSFGIRNLHNDSITFAIVTNVSNNTYKKCVPLYHDISLSKVAYVIPCDSLVIATEEITNKNIKIYKVSSISNNGKKINGYLPFQYIQTSVSLDSRSSLYKVKNYNGIHLRTSPNTSPHNIITIIPNGTIVIGYNINNKWLKITHITKDLIQSGYSQSDYLQLL